MVRRPAAAAAQLLAIVAAVAAGGASAGGLRGSDKPASSFDDKYWRNEMKASSSDLVDARALDSVSQTALDRTKEWREEEAATWELKKKVQVVRRALQVEPRVAALKKLAEEMMSAPEKEAEAEINKFYNLRGKTLGELATVEKQSWESRRAADKRERIEADENARKPLEEKVELMKTRRQQYLDSAEKNRLAAMRLMQSAQLNMHKAREYSNYSDYHSKRKMQRELMMAEAKKDLHDQIEAKATGDYGVAQALDGTINMAGLSIDAAAADAVARIDDRRVGDALPPLPSGIAYAPVPPVAAEEVV